MTTTVDPLALLADILDPYRSRMSASRL